MKGEREEEEEELNETPDRSTTSTSGQRSADIESPQKQPKKKNYMGLPDDHILIRFMMVFSCLGYLSSAVAMTLLNKYILSVREFQNPNVLVFCQNLVTVLIMLLRVRWGQVKFEWDSSVALRWIPTNLLYVTMLSSSGFSLKYLSVPMVTVFKNITVCLIAYGEQKYFDARHSSLVVKSLGLMVFGSLLAAITDLSFSLFGYLWMGVHILSQAGYVLYIRKVKTDIKLSEDQMVIYNNIISLPIFFLIAFVNGEIGNAASSENWESMSFIVVFFISCINGLLISVSTFLLLSVAGATTFAIVGALNKIPLTILGFLLFSNPISFQNAFSISVGLVAGLLYSKAKYDESKARGGVASSGHR